MTVTLYPDQMELVDRVRESMRSHKSVLMQSPTGSGKSRMGAYIAESVLAKGGSVVFDVPMKELRKQISTTFRQTGIAHSFVAAGQRFDPFGSCWVTTTPTLANRLDRAPRAKVLILDETHNGGAARNRIVEHYKAMGAWIIGLSATPERLDGKGLDVWYDDMIEGQSIRWLIDNKRLSDYRLFNASKPDLSALRMSGQEYRQSDVAGFMESQNILIGDAVSHYQKLAMGKRNVAYCASIKHSQMVAEAFNEAGIPAAHIDGKMDDATRTRIIKAFARRELLCLTNADLLLYGFDLAASSDDDNAVVESISDLKPTMSKAMQFQKNGRALRLKPDGSDAVIMDHASNAFNPDGSVKHGFPCADQVWNWKGRDKRKGDGKERTIPVRQCGSCFFVHRPSPACPSCGNVYPIASRVLDQVEGELVEVTREQLAKVARAERQVQGRAQTFEGLLELERRKGNKRGWADRVWIGRGNSRHGLTQRRVKWEREVTSKG